MHFDAVLNGLLSLALDRMQRIYDLLQIRKDLRARVQALNRRIFEVFYVPEQNRFRNRSDTYGYSELANALAVLRGACRKRCRAVGGGERHDPGFSEHDLLFVRCPAEG